MSALHPPSSTDDTILVVLSRGMACLMCRDRKRRCDGVKPICATCTKAGKAHLCIFDDGSQDQSLVQSHRDRVSRERALRDRVVELQDIIQALDTGGPQSVVPSVSRKSKSAIRSQSPSTAITSSTKFRLPNKESAIPAALGHSAWDWSKENVPSDIRDPLIAIFIQHGWQFALDFNIPRFMMSLSLSPSHPKALHPALLHAVLLNGCLYSPAPFRRHEQSFLKRAHKELNQQLAKGDRLLDFLRATALIGCYYYGRGRLREGYHYLSSAMRFSVGCGLHAIDSLSLDRQAHNPLLPPCADLVELGDRINTFWFLFSVDRAGSLLAAVPETISDHARKPYPTNLTLLG
ncbi:hypothetical protein BOTBODRAFT_196950 [Botryobasidium botryosum FD-172 SS1]|uniref:Zn(2)-C6 fungal-type domain-containing protein n=1 Tax=Botryobasidium botryosum (strain FD-172 SS1) TaxID=930990 RepID=A0A067MZU2_BOTB1|nr:hypothetical protein BOTBODRAFT_196950 [Botryobasidium botryosum FD-172 SS1]